MCDTVAAVYVETMLPATCRVVVEDSARPARRRREQRPDPARVNVSIPKPTPLLLTVEVGRGRSRRRRGDSTIVNVSMPKPTPSLQTVGVGRGRSRRRRPCEGDPHLSSLDESVGVGRIASVETVELTSTVKTATGVTSTGETDQGGVEEAYEFRNPPAAPIQEDTDLGTTALKSPEAEAASNALAWAGCASPGLGTRYKTHDMSVFAPAYKNYADASSTERTKMEREAVIANVLRRNQRRVCEERGIPPEVFRRIWEEYRESNTYQGRFFHREEIIHRESKDSTQRMQAALTAHREHDQNGTLDLYFIIVYCDVRQA